MGGTGSASGERGGWECVRRTMLLVSRIRRGRVEGGDE